MASLREDVWDLLGNPSSGLPVLLDEAGQCQCVGPVPRGTWSLQVMIGSSIWPLFLRLCFFYVCDSFSLVVVQDLICPQKAVHAICLQQSGLNYDAQHFTTSRPHQCSCLPRSNICLQGYNP